ncbi:DnaJ domain-containing protein [Nitrogeniibacter mangrovi]|uniref:DnaJ domain-containing protein n=1 Tax=Nitrogeniibacter mangrovi TaxID=2016596 RepID=A0A6C1B9H9_9RHOO|nr:DnaJ C-terminal domain-containing protein [Nitrogeniibacter mangrovi]QID19408.1 DnaJ domain-containing protein [Nitrogeniibacter mangrovi]
MEYVDYYAALGVERDASGDDIKRAFRKLARKYHPDVSKEPDAEARMKAINEAYAVLSDPERRAAYDQLGRGHQGGQDFTPPPGWDSGFEFAGEGMSPEDAARFSDFFSELFGGMGGADPFHASGRRHHATQGQDHHARIVLDLEDTFTGPTRQLSLQVPVADAQGRVRLQSRTLNVKIPVGIRAGQIIRLAGQGHPGPGGLPAGDLLLEVQFRPHARFRVDGRDLAMDLPVTPWEAALGAVIPVTLPAGTIKVRIPAGAQSGQALNVRGKGIPGTTPGDLQLRLKVVLPPASSDAAKAIYETMAKEMAFDPRATTGA